MFLGGVRVRFLTTLGVGVWFFCPTPSADAQLDHFYITLLNWEFWLKWYNFFWKFCWIRGFLLCTTISIDFNSQISFSLCQGLGVGNFGKVGVLYFTSTPQPCWKQGMHSMNNRYDASHEWNHCGMFERLVALSIHTIKLRSGELVALWHFRSYWSVYVMTNSGYTWKNMQLLLQ